MSFRDAIKTCFAKYVTFSGRASRPEYWWFVLFVFLGSLMTGLLDVLFFRSARAPAHDATRIFQPIFQLAILLPLLAAGWRRMHDTGRPGWLLLLPLGLALATTLFVFGGIMGFGMMQGPQFNGHGMAGISYVVFGMASVAQLILYVVLIWWLTRPGDPGPNDYGPPQGLTSSAQ